MVRFVACWSTFLLIVAIGTNTLWGQYCSVIESVDCKDFVTPDLCIDSNNCQEIAALALWFCNKYSETTFTDNRPQGFTQALPGQSGFWNFTLATPLSCTKYRSCSDLCVEYVEDGVIKHRCNPSGEDFIEVGPTYWLLVGNNPCVGS